MFKMPVGLALAVALISVPISGILLYKSSAKEIDKELASHQINEIVNLVKHVYISQEGFGEGNLLPVLSAGSGGRFSGLSFTPVMASKLELGIYKKQLRFQAIKDLNFSKNGEQLNSSIVGRIMVVGKGNSFTVYFPECPQDTCSKTSILIEKSSIG